MNSSSNKKPKIVFVMGATGTGKTKLSIDLALHFNGEIINCDKMQVYKGLSVVTNKATEEERKGISHHLMDVAEPDDDFSAEDFRRMVAEVLPEVVARDTLPIIVGGSNSFIEALMKDMNMYDSCFLWVDVDPPVLYWSLCERVNRMVEAGLIDEVRSVYDVNGEYSRGVKRSIGVAELDKYFKLAATDIPEIVREKVLQEAIEEIKENTWKLACCQLGKIQRFCDIFQPDIHRINTTGVFSRSRNEAEEWWRKWVLMDGIEVINRFLFSDGGILDNSGMFPGDVTQDVLMVGSLSTGLDFGSVASV